VHEQLPVVPVAVPEFKQGYPLAPNVHYKGVSQLFPEYPERH
jgi:hypothetical protein